MADPIVLGPPSARSDPLTAAEAPGENAAVIRKYDSELLD
jgi:hypothetical protein